MSWKIVNLVATADLKQSIDLFKISNLKHTIHDQEIYGGRVVYLKTPTMHGKITLFRSGKLISVGTKSPLQAKEDFDFTVNYLIQAHIITPITVKAKIVNIVALLETKYIGYLEKLSRIYGAMQHFLFFHLGK